MSRGHYLILITINVVLIGAAMGLHYGYHHYERIEEPEAVSRAGDPWPADLKAQMIESCAQYSIADREQCTCTFDWYEQHATLAEYLQWSALMASEQELTDEAQAVFFGAGEHCAVLQFITPTPVSR